jgi:hypothetical protein
LKCDAVKKLFQCGVRFRVRRAIAALTLALSRGERGPTAVFVQVTPT